MKFATHVVLFGQDKWIMKNIENSYPHVDKIYIAYSKLPWGYNPSARNQYTNSFDLDKIRTSRFFDKINIIEGDWMTEEAQRNACVEQAKKDKINYLMIHDADEFYFNNDFSKIVNFINTNPNFDVYKCAWVNFWKGLDYITLSDKGENIVGYPQVVINLDRGVRFKNKRTPTGSSITNINSDVVCHHASYALTDSELLTKLQTWGHHNDFNIKEWYNEVWLKWDINSTNLHPVSPSAWSKAVKYTKPLPEILR